MDNQKCSPKFLFGINIFIILIVFIVFFIPFIKNIVEYNNYKEGKCNVDNIKLPTSLMINSSWGECRCGRRCFSWNPIINIYGYIIKNTTDTTYNRKIYMFQENNIKTLKYTFFDESCISAKDNTIEHMEHSLYNSHNIYNIYNNKTIKCFYNTNLDRIIIFNNNIIDSSSSIIYYIMLSLLILCCMCQLFCNYNEICEFNY